MGADATERSCISQQVASSSDVASADQRLSGRWHRLHRSLAEWIDGRCDAIRTPSCTGDIRRVRANGAECECPRGVQWYSIGRNGPPGQCLIVESWEATVATIQIKCARESLDKRMVEHRRKPGGTDDPIRT